MKRIRLFATDVDGSLTDGKMYIGQSGELFKVFDIKDGGGIAKAGQRGIITCILTAKTSEIVKHRAAQLHVDEVHQGVENKLTCLKSLMEKYGVTADETAYFGDDGNDIDCIRYCGVSGCPRNASPEVREASTFVASKDGGDGAAREFIDWFLDAE